MIFLGILSLLMFFVGIIYLIAYPIYKLFEKSKINRIYILIALGITIIGAAIFIKTSFVYNKETEASTSKQSKKINHKATKITLKVNGKQTDYTDRELTANDIRQATITGTIKGDTKVHFLEDQGGDQEFNVEANSDGTFSKTITLPSSKAEISYWIDSEKQNKSQNSEDSTLLKVTIKSADYAAEASSISASSMSAASASSAAAASSSTEAASSKAAAAASSIADYRSDITYDSLARNPDQYKGQKVVYTGEVVQVLEGDEETDLRVAINGDYDDIVYVAFDPSIMNGSHILENDKIRFYGKSKGDYTYKATSGTKITVPLVIAKKINDQGTAPDDYGE
ncbi:hypothetical protein CF77_gp04 [Oenococcus phage phi9805]|uniref:TcdA-E operon negative regulator n=1 Tax=Oenococcus phage phi9805 TaxID=1435411 RepID=V9QKZ6_9CAUD|nr:hypothetical protein [Oenococcus oeni]YP_009005207.1 hypothetical protein CF77_gp04 [Oenococcus phage phi9805]AHC30361.1 hypothetical protein [Oenococcus phage phi9805]KGH60267.1 hypothetical protein X288_02165 [Oenococcus oeni IOEB_9805]KGH75588.1 hypothetical protein X287_04610 [Oenococcus oeni IOEB_9803]KGH78874.1 hypothetical protein X284_02105 [Oenococcus oeni IOEB_8417]